MNESEPWELISVYSAEIRDIIVADDLCYETIDEIIKINRNKIKKLLKLTLT